MIFRQILVTFFDPDSECLVKYDAFCFHIFDYACLRRRGLLLSKRFEIMEKLYTGTSKTLLKMASGRMYIPLAASPHPPPWICP